MKLIHGSGKATSTKIGSGGAREARFMFVTACKIFSVKPAERPLLGFPDAHSLHSPIFLHQQQYAITGCCYQNVWRGVIRPIGPDYYFWIITTTMRKQQSEFEFKYEGSDYIDINTLLTSQFHFLATINEIQKEVNPSSQLKIKIGSFDKGSFIVKLLIESNVINEIFTSDGVKTIGEVFAFFSALIGLNKYLKGKKATEVKESNNNVEITVEGENNSITVDKRVFNIYKNNIPLNNSIQKNFELLEQDEEIEGISIKEKKAKKPILEVPRENFEALSKPNPYLNRETMEEILREQVLFIKEPNLFPEKNKLWVWRFIHKGRDIKAKMNVPAFKQKINDGLKVGQGDRFVADLKICFRFDERFQTYIENGRYEVVEIHKIIERDNQAKFDL